MFSHGFTKTAATLVTMTPEEYYEVVREKDPFVGANVGAVVGGILGSSKGKSAKGALTGAVLGGGAGAATAHVLGKAIRHYQAKKVRRMAHDLNLKATPGRKD